MSTFSHMLLKYTSCILLFALTACNSTFGAQQGGVGPSRGLSIATTVSNENLTTVQLSTAEVNAVSAPLVTLRAGDIVMITASGQTTKDATAGYIRLSIVQTDAGATTYFGMLGGQLDQSYHPANGLADNSFSGIARVTAPGTATFSLRGRTDTANGATILEPRIHVTVLR